MISQPDLCKQLWSSFNALKEATEEARKFLSEGKDLSLEEINERIKTLSAAKDEYEKSQYTTLSDGREIYTLDYLSILGFCEINNISFDKILYRQSYDFLEDRRVVKFDCSFTQVKDLSLLANLTSLRELRCSFTQVKDLRPLASLTSLEWLDCEGTKVSDLSPLASLPSLKWLYCQGTQVSDLRPLVSLRSLEGLHCQGTQVSDLRPLASLTSLTWLNCSDTQVKDLSPLANLPSLIVYCRNTPLTSESIALARKKRWMVE
jgi:Leucine-rich repeat (LRR) protein